MDTVTGLYQKNSADDRELPSTRYRGRKLSSNLAVGVRKREKPFNELYEKFQQV